jgi:hypothetical protein
MLARDIWTMKSPSFKDAIPIIRSIGPIDLDPIISNDQILYIDDFYEDLAWLNNQNIINPKNLNLTEQVVHLPPLYRYPLLKQVEHLIPNAFYPTDTGWLRSNQSTDSHQLPQASYLHDDRPYLVLSVCLTTPDLNRGIKDYGTIFYKHRDFGFKKLDSGDRKFKQFSNIFSSQCNNEEMWIPWRQLEYKKNRAFIYNGSLLHRMPSEAFGDQFYNSRMMQMFSFRLQGK